MALKNRVVALGHQFQQNKFFKISSETVSDWLDDKAATQAAALAYYTAFSIAPLLLVAISVAGLAFGHEAVQGQLKHQISGMVGVEGATAIEQMMQAASKPSQGIIGTVIGVIILIFGATGVFAQLQDSLNSVWDAPKSTTNGVLDFLRVRFLSFAVVLGIGFLLLVSLALSAVLAALSGYLDSFLPAAAIWSQLLNFIVSFGVTTLLFAMIYKILPDAPVRWGDVWLGSTVTAMLIGIGKFAIGIYLGKAAVGSAYGAAGSLAVILLWVYYSAQILLLGAEFTHVHSKHRGGALSPSKTSAA